MKNNIGWILSVVLIFAVVASPVTAQKERSDNGGKQHISIEMTADKDGEMVTRMSSKQSQDGGKTWEVIQTGPDGSINNVAVFTRDGQKIMENGKAIDPAIYQSKMAAIKFDKASMKKMSKGTWSSKEGFKFDPAKLLSIRTDRYQNLLGATDEEWEIIKPLLAAVLKKQDEIRRSVASTQSGAIIPNGREAQSDLPVAIRNLREKMKSKEEMKTGEAKLRLKEFKAARVKQNEELTRLQNKLRTVLTVIQEVKLTVSGILD